MINIRMREFMDIIVEQKLSVRDEGMGLKTYMNDDVVISGGMRAGNSPAGYLRTKYMIYDMSVFAAGGGQEEAEAGYVMVWENSEGIVGLVDIKINKNMRRNSLGSKVIRSLCDSSDKHFHISDIQKSAVSFWASMGCVFFQGEKQLSTAEARKRGGVEAVIPNPACQDEIALYANLRTRP